MEVVVFGQGVSYSCHPTPLACATIVPIISYYLLLSANLAEKKSTHHTWSYLKNWWKTVHMSFALNLSVGNGNW